MKHIKSYQRESAYKKLPYEVEQDLKEKVREYISGIDYKKTINKLKLNDFEEALFDYEEIWDYKVLTTEDYNEFTTNIQYTRKNLYRMVDDYLKNKYTAVQSRNSLTDIVSDFYQELKIEDLMNNRVLRLLKSKTQEQLKDFYDRYEDELPKDVKKEIEWVKSASKYNL